MRNFVLFIVFFLILIFGFQTSVYCATEESILDILGTMEDDAAFNETAIDETPTQEAPKIADVTDQVVEEPDTESLIEEDQLFVDDSAFDEPVASEQTFEQVEDEPIATEPDPIESFSTQQEAGYLTGYRTHRVWIWQETRDCLWNLSKKYYGDPWMWKAIYQANQDKIQDPRVIFPKQILVIPPLEN